MDGHLLETEVDHCVADINQKVDFLIGILAEVIGRDRKLTPTTVTPLSGIPICLVVHKELARDHLVFLLLVVVENWEGKSFLLLIGVLAFLIVHGLVKHVFKTPPSTGTQDSDKSLDDLPLIGIEDNLDPLLDHQSSDGELWVGRVAWAGLKIKFIEQLAELAKFPIHSCDATGIHVPHLDVLD